MFVLTVVPTMDNAYHTMKDFTAIFVPVGLTSIAAVLERQGYAVSIVDADAENLTLEQTIERIVKENPSYVGSTCMTATMDITNKFYARLKEKLPHVKIIVGGPHVSALPKRTLEDSNEIDIVVKGEGEETIIELLDAMEQGRDISAVKGLAFREGNKIIETGDRELIQDLGKLPMPAYHLVKYEHYRAYMWSHWVSGYRKPVGAIFTHRGCFGKCNFCASQVMWGRKIRCFPIQRIKDELDLLVNTYKIKVLYFQDDTFTANNKLVNEVCDYIIEKGYHKQLEINACSRADTAHLPTLKKMRQAGVRWLFIGVESGNQRILDAIHKDITIQQIKDAFEKANAAGLFVSGTYMIGNLGDTRETVMDTINLACEMKQDYAAFSIAVPVPGSDIYDHCIDKGATFPTWNDFGLINSEPIPLNDALGPEALKELRTLAVNRFFKRYSYLIRMLMRFRNVAVVKDFITMYHAVKKAKDTKKY